MQSLKSVLLTSHDSLKTKGCLCRHGLHKDPSALVQSPGCGCRVFSHTFQSHNKTNSIFPLELPTSQICFNTSERQVYTYIVDSHVLLNSSDTLICKIKTWAGGSQAWYLNYRARSSLWDFPGCFMAEADHFVWRQTRPLPKSEQIMNGMYEKLFFWLCDSCTPVKLQYTSIVTRLRL